MVQNHGHWPSRWDSKKNKTEKASLSRFIETESVKLHEATGKHATVIDAMSIVQKVNGENLTFDELSETVLKQVLLNGQKSRRIGVVFDVYIGESIKTAERVTRGSKDVIVFFQIKGGHRIKNWKHMLTSTKTKDILTKFLAESWKYKQE